MSAIPKDKLQDYQPRLEAIADAWAYNEGGGRTEILKRLVDHAEREWLSAEWVDGAYEALLKNKHLEFHYDHKTNVSGWLAGESPEQVRNALSEMKNKGFKIKRKL